MACLHAGSRHGACPMEWGHACAQEQRWAAQEGRAQWPRYGGTGTRRKSASARDRHLCRRCRVACGVLAVATRSRRGITAWSIGRYGVVTRRPSRTLVNPTAIFTIEGSRLLNSGIFTSEGCKLLAGDISPSRAQYLLAAVFGSLRAVHSSTAAVLFRLSCCPCSSARLDGTSTSSHSWACDPSGTGTRRRRPIEKTGSPRVPAEVDQSLCSGASL